MKIPQSVRTLYYELLPKYEKLGQKVDALVSTRKEKGWHYDSRIKGEESFALKLETGRVKDPQFVEDFFGCTLVVENHSRTTLAEKAILEIFPLYERRPKESHFTHLAPYSFDFDDLRLYVKWVDDPKQRPTDLDGLVFEVQIKTFLQHAWGIATHDFIYKSDDVDWPASRIAYQVKAMLESAELAIGEAQRLTGSAMLCKSDRNCTNLRSIIGEIKKRWKLETLPKDLRRLAQILADLSSLLSIPLAEIWAAIDEATRAGEGTNTLNLSPYGAILASLIRQRGSELFDRLACATRRGSLFVPLEVSLPEVSAAAKERIIQPPTKL